ncbi:protein of unknown function [Methylacidimicrobium sp. AP8]|nr:protein of unknown function [Methylacidimicrobium sp. AP8]
MRTAGQPLPEPRMALLCGRPSPALAMTRLLPYKGFRQPHCRVVQLVAHQTLDLGVLGSSPSAAAT